MTMHTTPNAAVGAAASRPNPKLKQLEFLIGEWRTTGTHPLKPGAELRGRASFTWSEGGAFITMRTDVDEPDFPDGVAIIGSDDGADKFIMIYFDERGTSRISNVSVGHLTLSWQRDDPRLAQSLTITADESGNRLISKGKMSENAGPWTDDLSQVFTREGS